MTLTFTFMTLKILLVLEYRKDINCCKFEDPSFIPSFFIAFNKKN